MNWNNAAAIVGFIVLLLVGTQAALGIREHMRKNATT